MLRKLRRLYSNFRFGQNHLQRRHLYAFLRSFPAAVRAGGGRRVVFNPVKSYQWNVVLFESFLAARVARDGGSPVVLIDDGVLHQHDLRRFNVSTRRDHVREWLSSRFLGGGLYGYYSEFSGGTDEAEAIAARMIACDDFEIGGVDLRQAVRSSLVKHYTSTFALIEKESDYDERLREFTHNAVLSYLVAENVCDELDPEVLVTHHGIYSTWAPFTDHFRARDIPVITYSLSGFKADSVRYIHRSAGDGFREWEDHMDPKTAERRAAALMEQRFSLKTTNLQRFPGYGDDPGTVRTIRELCAGRPAYGLFTNVFWDASLTHGDTIFESATAWIEETIRHFLSDQEKVLIVRGHPLELVNPPRVTATDLVSRILGKPVPHGEIFQQDNVVYVPAGVKLKSYALFEIFDCGIIYNGTLGLEMMYAGLPVLVGGGAPYLHRPFTTRLGSKEAYFEALDEIEAIRRSQEAEREEMDRFICYFFDDREMPLPYFGTERDRSDAAETILADPTLRRIARDILTA